MSPKTGLRKLLTWMMRIRRDDVAGRTLAGLLLGCISYGLVILAIGIIFVPDRLFYAAGVVLGEVAATLSLINMYDSTEASLMMNEKRAKSFTFVKKTVRYVIVIIILVVTIKLNIWMFVGAALAVYTIKLSALTNPLIDKLIDRIIS